jgi:hypothetical protein
MVASIGGAPTGNAASRYVGSQLSLRDSEIDIPLRTCQPTRMKNRKRHSSLWHWSKIASVAAMGVAILGCAPRARIVTETSYIPQRVEPLPTSAKAALEDARAKSAAASIHASRASDAVDRTRKGIENAGSNMQAVIIEVARLKSQKNATENELGEVYRRMVEIEKDRSVLLDDIMVAQSELGIERQLRKEAESKVVDAQTYATQMEQYAAQSKAALLHEQKVAKQLRDDATSNAKAAGENAALASELRGANSLKNKLLWGVSILAFIEFLLILFLIRTRIPLI